MDIDFREFPALPTEQYMPDGTAPSQIYNALKHAHDRDDFNLDSFADALREHTVAIARMLDIADPGSSEYNTVSEIADAAKAYRSARAALASAQEAFAEAQVALSSALDQGLVDYCVDPTAQSIAA